MEIVITTTYWIEIQTIIEDNGLNAKSTDVAVMEAINDYVSGLDDPIYYAIGSVEIEQIFSEVCSRIRN